MPLIALFTTLALAQQPALTLESDAELTGGSTVTLTIDGVASGQRVFLVAGDAGTSCPPQTAACLSVISPTVVARRQGQGGPVEVTLTVPQGVTVERVQAATATAVSNHLEVGVSTGGGTANLAFSGVLATCPATDEADLLVEYVGEADSMIATAYLHGVAVASQELDLLEGLPGAVFLWAEANGVPASDCSQLTWVYEAFSATEEACIAQGDEEQDLIDDGVIGAHCFAW